MTLWACPPHKLTPFEHTELPLEVAAHLDMNNRNLNALFLVRGPWQKILFPALSATPSSKDRLWEQTCFELFLKPSHREDYWEFNFSPSGDFACYHLDSYRTGLKTETRVAQISCALVSTDAQESLWRARADLSQISGFPEIQKLQIGISVVLLFKSGRTSHWALTHKKNRPDFHDPESFIFIPSKNRN